MASISLEIPQHLLLAILKKLESHEFLAFVRSCRFINGLIEANLNSFNIYIGDYFNIGMIDRNGYYSLYQDRDDIPENHDTKICLYQRWLSDVDTFHHETFEFSELRERLQRFSWCKPSIIKFGCSIRMPESVHFSLEKLRKVLEELQEIKMTCDSLEMFTFTGVEDAFYILKPKTLEIELEKNGVLERISPELLLKLDEFSLFGKCDLKVVMREIVPYCKKMVLGTNEQNIKEELPAFVQKCIAGTVYTQSLSIMIKRGNLPEIEELAATLVSFPKQITLKAEQYETFLVLIPLEGNCVTTIVSKTDYRREIDISFTKTFHDLTRIYYEKTYRDLMTDFQNQIDQINLNF